MRNLIIALLMVVAVQQPQTSQATGTIRVLVRVAGTDEPIAGAQIKLVGPAAAPPPPPARPSNTASPTNISPAEQADLLAYLTQQAQLREASAAVAAPIATAPVAVSGAVSGSTTAVTDANGIATIPNLAMGTYSVSGRSDGYFGTTTVNGRQTANSSTLVTLSPSQPTQNVSISLTHGASVSGRVHIAPGAPLSNVRVEAGVYGYLDGHRSLTERSNVLASSNGDYLLSQLPPGEYVIREIDTRRGVSTYYPGTYDVGSAVKIGIQGSEEIVGIDFDLPKTPTFKVSGKVLDAPHRISGMTFVPRDVDNPDSAISVLVNGSIGANGEFEINGLPPGSWDIFPVIPLTSTAASTFNTQQYVTGRARVDIVDHDIRDVTITVKSSDVNGRVLWPGAPPTQAALRIRLMPRENIPSELTTHVHSTQNLNPDGAFSFLSVPPGKYSLEVLGIPAPYYISDIRMGTRSIYNDGVIEISDVGTDRIDPIEVQLSKGAGSVQVDLAPINARATLVPSGSRRQNPMFYQVRTASALFTTVPPGEYKLFVWRNLPVGGAEQNAQFLAPYEDQGVPVTVVAGQRTTVRAPIIP